MTQPVSTPAQPLSAEERRGQRRTLAGTGIGNALEWYDWNVYAAFAVFIAAQLFDSADPASAILSTLAIFAVGFLARPFGGFVFGWIADHKGRKFALMLAVGLASLGSLMIAVTPTYETAGVLSSVMLLVARIIQGLAHGGEMPSAQTYLAEAAPPKKRGLWSSWIYITGTAGVLFGQLLGAGLIAVLSDEAMSSFGWRIPFALGAVLGLYGLYMRRGMDESEIFEKVTGENKSRERILPQLLKHRKPALQVIGMTMGLTIAYYVWAINVPTYAATQLGMDRGLALLASAIGSLVFIAVLPLWGALSDRVGRKRVLLTGSLGTALLYYPMTLLLGNSIVQLVFVVSIMLIFLAAFWSVAPVVYAEIFPTAVRTTGAGVPYAITIALFGGTAPYLQAWTANAFTGVDPFPIYVIVLLLLSSLVISTLPETKAKDLN